MYVHMYMLFNIISISICILYTCIRVESGSDDPDNLGHLNRFFGGSVGLIRKLNYLDVTRISQVF